MNMAKFGWAAALAAAVVVAACGGGGGDAPAAVAATNAAVPASKTTVAALSGATVNFPAVPALGTTGTTTLKIETPVVGTGASATIGTPTFTLTSAGNTASGEMSFGSCIFIIRASTFPADHPLALGKTLTVNPCETDIGTSGAPADGSTRAFDASLQLGNTNSQPVTVPVTLQPNGGIILSLPPSIAAALPPGFQVNAGTITIQQVTGGG